MDQHSLGARAFFVRDTPFTPPPSPSRDANIGGYHALLASGKNVAKEWVDSRVANLHVC